MGGKSRQGSRQVVSRACILIDFNWWGLTSSFIQLISCAPAGRSVKHVSDVYLYYTTPRYLLHLHTRNFSPFQTLTHILFNTNPFPVVFCHRILYFILYGYSYVDTFSINSLNVKAGASDNSLVYYIFDLVYLHCSKSRDST